MAFASAPGGAPAGGPSVWVGRGVELAALARGAHDAAEGRCQVVHVLGRSGVGRTALVRRAGERMTGVDVHHLTCHAADRGRDFALAARLVGTVGAGGLDPRRTSLAHAGDRLWGAVVDAQSRAPLALVVDDLHRADERSVEVLGYVLRRLSAARVLVVLTTTPEDAAARRRLVPALGAAHTLTLTGFGRDEVAELAAAYGVVDASEVDRIHHDTAGRPADVIAVLDHRVERRPGEESPAVPPTVTAALRERLAGLPDDSRRMIEALAVLDGSASTAVTAHVAEVTDVAAAIEPLLRADLVRWYPNDPVGPLEITSPLAVRAVQEVTRDPRRRRLHGLAADVVDVAVSWRHRVAATTATHEAVAAELERDAADALALGDTDRAVQHLNWAADLGERRVDRERRMLGAVVHGAPARLEDRELRRRIERCLPGPLRDLTLALVRWHVDHDADGARALVDGALDGVRTRAPEAGPEWLPETAGALAAELALVAVDGRAAVAHAGAVLVREHTRDLRASLRATRAATFGRVLISGPSAELGPTPTLPPDAALGPDAAEPALERAVVALLSARFGEALDRAEALLADDASASGERVIARVVAAHALLGLGRYPDSQERAHAVVVDPGPHARLAAVARAQLVVAASTRGRAAEAEQHLDALIAAPRHPETAALVGWARTAIARARGDRAGVAAAFDDVVVSPEPAEAAVARAIMMVTWAPPRVEALIAADRLPEAEELLDEMADRDVPAFTVGMILFHGMMAERAGRRETAVRLYRRGTEVPEHPDEVTVHRATLEMELGRVLQDRAAAVRWWRSARRRFAGLGATAYVEQCDDLLRDVDRALAGVRDDADLTRRERQVADLVGEGLTNRQVAVRLHVTEKTVEYHLHKVYDKLGVSSRRELRPR